ARVAQPADVAAAEDDAPLRRLELLQQEPCERRLAGARSSDDEDELALVDPEADLVEGCDVRLVDLRDGLEHDHRACCRLRLLLGLHLAVWRRLCDDRCGLLYLYVSHVYRVRVGAGDVP